VILCGDYGVGKTSLFRRFFYDDFWSDDDDDAAAKSSMLGMDFSTRQFDLGDGCFAKVQYMTFQYKLTSLCSASADNVTLLVFAAERRAAAAPGGRRYRSSFPARRAHSSKRAAATCSDRQMGQTDGRTPYVTQTLPHTMRPASRFLAFVMLLRPR